MNDDMKARALRAVQCDKWRWMPGMLAVYTRLPIHPARVVAVDDDYTPPALDVSWGWNSSDGGVHPRECLPDFDDPATRGCLLALVRKATGHPTAVVEVRPMRDAWRGIVAAAHATESWVYLSDWIMAPTPQLAEVSALIDALEAA